MRDIVYVEHQHYVSAKENSFRFVDLISKEEHFIPFDDVEWFVFDNERSYFSKRLITVCMDRNIGILFCDKKHSPLTELTLTYGHSQRVKRLEQQLALLNKTKRRLWRKIVMSKINNQADCLSLMTGKEEAAKNLQLIGKTVDDGDPKNREAYAAREYFFHLFGQNFKRGRFDDAVNSGLNYGYALIRAVIRRELAFHGLEPSIGINHASNENPFNLSDDFIEPFRPFVDALVYEKIVSEEVLAIELNEKKQLLEIFVEKCVIGGKVYTITDAIRLTVSSFIQCLENNSSGPLELPMFIEVGK